MKKIKGLTKRLAAMVLSGLLVVGAVPGTALASESPENLGQTAETAAEDLGQILEISAEDLGDTLSEEVSAEGFSEDAALQGEEAAVEYYTVILDANGGYFENEWDDSIGEIVERAEVISKQIPVGGTVAAAPVFTETDQDGQAMTFAGWSLEPDGELVTAGHEEYAPVDSCTLYAVWEAEDPSAGDNGSDIESQDIAEENTDQIDASQDSVDVDEAAEGSAIGQDSVEADEAAEGSQDVRDSVEVDETTEGSAIGQDSGELDEAAEGIAVGQDAWDNGTAEDSSVNENPASEADTDSETIDENEQAAASDQEADYADEETEKATGESSDAAISVEETQAELNESSREEETVSEDAAYGEVESGTCGDNLTWTLDEEGTLTISGSGEMYDYDSVDNYSPFSEFDFEKVIIEDGVTSIGDYAFKESFRLQSIEIPDSVTSIGKAAFYASGLPSITLPKGVTSISESMFYSSDLTSVTIPDSVTSIGSQAFSHCSSLTRITIPDSVTSIGSQAFYNCSSLTSVTIPDSITSIGSQAFYNCSSLTSVTIPDSVTSIGLQAFYNCSSLTSVTIPESITSISGGMFSNCSSLKSIEIPDSVTSIEGYAFLDCSSLESITIPKGVTSIGEYVFESCSSLKNILVEDGNQNYSSMGGVLFNSDQTVLVYYPGGREGGYAIPDSVRSIGSTAFDKCSNLTSITIPDGAINISNGAFFGCLGLTDITIPDKVTSIGSSAFQACRNLTSITIPDSVTSIGNNAFRGCSNLVIYCYSGSKAEEYAGEKNIPFKILINRASVTIPDQTYTYTGDSLKPEVTVILNETQLTKDTDYEVTYSNNIDVGVEPATVIVTGTGDYAGKKELTFTIEKAVQTITASDLTLPYHESGKTMVTGNQGQLSYTSSDLSVAEVDTFGNVTAKKVGTATITITAAETKNYKKTEKEITVTVVKATQSITASDLSLTYMETGSIIVSGNEGSLTYESSNTAIATVDTAGKVTAVGGGTAKITITAAETDNYKETTKEITVNVAKAAQSITASNLSLTYPNSGKIIASGNKGSLTYKSSNTAIATVDSAGKVTAKSGGTAKITITAAETAQYNAASKTITVNVAKAGQTITAKAAAPVIFAGQTTTVSVTGAKGTRSFKSSDTTIAAVDKSTGKVTAKKAGTVKITAASGATAQYNAAPSKTVTIKVLPAVTSSLTAANQATGIKLTWKKVSGAAGYKIYRNSTLIKTITGDSTVTYVDTKANTNMTRYIYKVVVKGPAGDSSLARRVTAYRVNRPVLSSVTNSGVSTMTAKWTRTARATGYQIKYSTSKTFASDNGTVSAYGAATDSRRIANLKKGKTYYVKIRAYKVVGNTLFWSEWSPTKTVRISK